MAGQAPTGPVAGWLLTQLAQRDRGLLARLLVLAHWVHGLPRRLRRALCRRLALTLGELALLLALGQGPGWAATMVVDGTTCTLVDAITAANTDTTTGGCPAGSGADTLVLVPGSTHTLTSSNNTTLGGATGLPVVTSTITIQGNGSTVQRSSASAFRLLAVQTTGNLTVQQLTLHGGQILGNGGGVYNKGTLTLSQCTLTGNTASSSSGGGVFNSGTLTLTQSTLSGNTASFGGGVFNIGTLTLVQTLVSGNTATTGPEIYRRTSSTVTVDNFNLFGQNGNSGLSGVTAGATDIVPSGALSTILTPTLAFNGGPAPGG
jgi:hypothetical protein